MISTILAVVSSFLIAIFAIPSIITVAKLKNLYDKPEERKIHTLKIPRLGGLAIFVAFSLAILLFGDFKGIEGAQFIGAALIMLFFGGLKDDIIILSPLKKLYTQLLSAGLVTYFTNIKITDLHGVFGVNEIPLVASISLSMFMIIVITNSVNLIDGVDGLAGSLSLIMSLTFGLYFYDAAEYDWALIAFTLSGAILGFLFFNFSPAKIFMGDAGSLTVGFLLSIFTIHFIESNSPSFGSIIRIKSAPGLALAILVVPLYDTLRVFVLRSLNRTSPFKADKNHLHHWLIKNGQSHKQVTLIMSLVNVLFILIAIALRDNPAYLVLTIIGSLALIVGQLPIYFYRHKISDIEADEDVQEEIEQSLYQGEFKNK
ncbi:MAG: undecaprenyl/decaprenyl-phosphate alpha-N-acetylglucosaminyl 1-phosphate transferase [Bacteroidia bacterium]|nr:undecaprenyl/decaprenyl-phosphate alpha-N-acetylglucosaminyl 1-phosphate transferase [Bacteroidia bacterium]MCF8446297.1 undecaprenyl/decaprenyl-phosphate alpha-N-acetylglucosaminyl 1-phosphate transferase [Bacteroidia bacterium]